MAKRAQVGIPVGIHTGGLAKRHFTWSIIRNYKGYTPDSIGDDDVEHQLETALSEWSSVANVSFTRVPSGGEVTFEWVDDLQIDIPRVAAVSYSLDSLGQPLGVIPEAYGAQILFAARSHDSAGNVVDLNWAKHGRIQQLATHEVGHFLGMWHAFNDPDYGSSKDCSGEIGCGYPQPNDASIMSYDYKCTDTVCMSYLSAYDVAVIQRKYGPNPYGVPLIELWIPGWAKHFYMTSWPEANVLSNSGTVQGLARFTGMIHKDPKPGSSPLYRYYGDEPGVGPRQYFALSGIQCGPSPLRFEGLMGYLPASGTGSDSGTVPLYDHYSERLHDDRLTTDAKPASGYARLKELGRVIPFGRFPRAD